MPAPCGSLATSTGHATTQFPHPVHNSGCTIIPVSSAPAVGRRSDSSFSLCFLKFSSRIGVHSVTFFFLDSIATAKAADIVEEMPPDEAADVLQKLSPEVSAGVDPADKQGRLADTVEASSTTFLRIAPDTRYRSIDVPGAGVREFALGRRMRQAEGALQRNRQERIGSRGGDSDFESSGVDRGAC